MLNQIWSYINYLNVRTVQEQSAKIRLAIKLSGHWLFFMSPVRVPINFASFTADIFSIRGYDTKEQTHA